MISLETGATFRGKAGTATAITYTLLGDEINTVAGTDSFKTLAQGQLGTSTATLYTVPGSTQTLIREIHLANTTGSPVTGVTFFVNGSASTNQLNGGLSIPAGGSALFSNNGWVVSDSAGGTTPTTLTLSGDVTGSGNSTIVTTIANDAVTNSRLANVASGTFKGRVTAATGDPEDLTGTQATTLLDAATTSLKGLQSANDKLKEDNIWVDAHTIGILTSNTGAQNVTAFNNWYATAPLASTLYFPPGLTYDFNAELTLNRDIRLRVLGAGKGRSILRTTSTSANLFNQTVDGFYISFEELGFGSTQTARTAGAAIKITANNTSKMDVRRCEFQNQFNGIELVGTTAGNIGTLSECIFNAPSTTAGTNTDGAQIKINGANINMMITNCTIDITGVSTTGMMVNQSGAVQITGCDFIGGKNTLLVNATATVSALFFTNCFFDQATLGSTVKFMGTSAISRIKFAQCGITTGNANNLAACEIAGTGSGTSIPEAIDFLQCDFYNAYATTGTTGLLITGVRGIDIRSSRIAGFAVGIDITPYSANTVTNFGIAGNTIGPTENFAGNGTGIRLNANGAITYGKSHISNNDLSGNTTAPLTVGSTVVFDNNQFFINNNIGLATSPLALIATPANPGATHTILQQVRLDANALQKGTTIRFKAAGIITGTGPTITGRILCGPLGTTADPAIAATPAVATASGTGWDVEMYFISRAESSAATATAAQGYVLGTAPGKSTQAATVNVAANAVLFVTFTYQAGGTVPNSTILTAFTEVLRQ